MDYVFELGTVRGEALLPQLSAALEKRVELTSRKRLPWLWKLTDRLNNAPRASEEVLRRRRKRYKIYGGVLVFLGVFLLVSGLMEPRKLAGPLIVGTLAIAWGLFSLFRRGGRSGRPSEGRFDEEARALLAGLSAAERAGAHVTFSEKHLTLETPGGERKAIAYGMLEYAFETADLLLLCGEEESLTLQKRELTWGNWADFRAFLRRKVEAHAVFHEA